MLFTNVFAIFVAAIAVSAADIKTDKAAPPPPQAHGSEYCIQEWFGTAPFCQGQCAPGWKFVRYDRIAQVCTPTHGETVQHCQNQSGAKCFPGYQKALCEQCFRA